MANKGAHLTPIQLARARGLLQVALEHRAELLPARTTDDLQQIDVRLRRGRRVKLTLRPFRGRRDSGQRGTTVLVLNRASPKLVEDLRRERRSFVDIARGAVCLELPSLMIDRTGLRPARRARALRPLRSPFADRASLVCRLLVEHPGRTWQLRELAAHAGVSTMTASHVVRQLQQMRALELQRRGRASEIRLLNVRTLVELWATHYEWTKNERLTLAAPIGDVRRFLPRLQRVLGKRRWALTMQAGASLVAPHAAWDKIHLYLEEEQGEGLPTAFREDAYHPSERGRLVVMRPWYRDSVWHGLQSIEGFPVVSDLQLVLDLWHYKDRGREQAEHILQAILGQHSSD